MSDPTPAPAPERTFQSREIERAPESFVGLHVTMAGKGGINWERTTITRYDPSTDKLHLAGGEEVTRIFSEPIREPITEGWTYPWEVARGIVHQAPTEAPAITEGQDR
ncbi:hypothetical protein [Sphaerisporangium aureirubrum]|uniref:Uncharacterized protein n=1 Tax=Sphaerisporangium aureirubrum TaxID=1544736 RepID=A0ABW1NCG0_9ACTN